MRLLTRLLIALVLLFASPDFARAFTLYFAGGEDIDFTLTGSATFSTSSSNHRSTYSRLAVATTSENTADPPTNRLISPIFTSVSTLWFHAWIYEPSGTDGSGGNGQLLTFYGSDGVRRLMLRNGTSFGTTKISKRNSAGTITDLVTCSSGFPSNAAIQQLDISLNYAVSGAITLYVNSVQFCTFSGDVTTDSVTAVNQFDISSPTGGGNDKAYWSEILVTDTDTRPLSLQTLAPQAAGTTQQWSGAVVGNLNGNSYNDASFNSTTTNSQISDWTIPALVAGAYNILAVKQAGRVSIGATGPQHFAFTCRPAGQSDTASSTQNPNNSFNNYAIYWITNCATASAWAPADFTGANFGEESLP